MTEQEMQALIAEGVAIDAGEAAHAEAAAAGQLDSQGQIVAVNPDAAAMEWMFIPVIVATIAKTLYPETVPMYSDERCMDVARAFVPVAEKYGWNGNQYGAEMALGMACFGFTVPAVMAHRARKKAAAEEADGERQ